MQLWRKCKKGAACLRAVPLGIHGQAAQMKDYYKILGVDRQARTEEIKKAYRRLARQYHPDVIKGDKQKEGHMYEIQEAYACLQNEERRRKYDEECLKNFERTAGGREPSAHGRPDMGRFERFFGFQPGKGMETYRDSRAKKAEGPIKPEEIFAAFFGSGNMREANRGNAAGRNRKKN